MSDGNETRPIPATVVERFGETRPLGVSRALESGLRALCATLATVLTAVLWITLPAGSAMAQDAPKAPMRQTVSANITDPQNLLGGSVSKVSDEIASTREKTGVNVRLLYLEQFAGAKDPNAWVAGVLRSLKPAPNTVMLAVASKDGKLVVAASQNSDQWLKSSGNVDKLSQAALDPIDRTDVPDWSGSAIAMMEEIKTLKRHSTMMRTALVVAIVVVALLAVALIVFVLVRRNRSGGGKGRQAGDAADAGGTGDASIAGSGGKRVSGSKGTGGPSGPRHKRH
ncbi:TPM domain-containing protein [Bifidobacterium sp. ESL0763]|uniref:TPM domain-containing protein n=1 Tax=Bifidobacterium sp. ESL0763 TaxID=2983227 RepID=UPI0023F92201|nr:TPM domain-containing protein [Bifidobacterium sp. ESL0763]MDF7663669.1 TPM domain-containing protein [Bifidobacterium sp. ESL0763]